MTLNLKLLNRLISNINVSYISKHKYTKVELNQHILKIIIFLQKKNYIVSFAKDIKNKKIIIYLKYSNFNPTIFKLKSLSTPGRKNYISILKMKKWLNNHPDYVVLTKRGVLLLSEAYKLGIGGLLLFELKI